MKKKLLVLIVLLMVLLGGDYMLRRAEQPPPIRGYAEGEIEFIESDEEMLISSIQGCVDEIDAQIKKIRTLITKQKGE